MFFNLVDRRMAGGGMSNPAVVPKIKPVPIVERRTFKRTAIPCRRERGLARPLLLKHKFAGGTHPYDIHELIVLQAKNSAGIDLTTG